MHILFYFVSYIRQKITDTYFSDFFGDFFSVTASTPLLLYTAAETCVENVSGRGLVGVGRSRSILWTAYELDTPELRIFPGACFCGVDKSNPFSLRIFSTIT